MCQVFVDAVPMEWTEMFHHSALAWDHLLRHSVRAFPHRTFRIWMVLHRVRAMVRLLQVPATGYQRRNMDRRLAPRSRSFRSTDTCTLHLLSQKSHPPGRNQFWFDMFHRWDPFQSSSNCCSANETLQNCVHQSANGTDPNGTKYSNTSTRWRKNFGLCFS